MKRTITTAASAVLFLFVGSGSALAQDEEADTPSSRPVEGWTCHYNEGKSRADLDKVNAEWNEWMDETGQEDYFAFLMTPQFFGELNFDVAWIGVYRDGHALGAGTDLWVNEGGELGAKFGEVVNCSSHMAFASQNVRKPQSNDEESDGQFVLNFANCSFEKDDDGAYDEFMAAQKEWNAYADEHGITGGAWIWWPIYGEADDSYDFKYIVGNPDYTALGANWQKFSEGHWRKSEELFGDLLDCDISRVYDASVIREWADSDD